MATIAPLGKYRAFDDNGGPLALGKLYTYEAGTTTPKSTFTTEAGDVANTNPVILDASGYADVWLGDGGYKFMLTDADDATIFTVDNIGGTGSSVFGGTVNDISSNTTITSVYANSVNICTGTITLSLLDAVTAGEGFYFSVKNDGSGIVTIDPDAGETIDGQATKTIPAGGSCLVITDGDEWFTLFFDATANGNNNFTGNNTFSGSSTFTGNVLFPDDGELTIASGVITVTGVYHTVDTEGDASTDDLVTINGGSDGQILTLRIENNARVVVLKSTGNIDLVSDVTLSATDSPIDLIYDGALSKWLQKSATATQGALADTALQEEVFVDDYFHAQDRKTQGTAGGGASAATTAARVLNTEVENTITGASLGSNQITLPAGTYRIDAISCAYKTNETKLRLYDTTAAAYIVEGVSSASSSGDACNITLYLNGKFTLAVQSVLELRQYTLSAQATNGLGLPVSQGIEVYTDVEIWKTS